MENAKKFFEEVIKTEEAKKLFATMEKPVAPEEVFEAYASVAKQLGIELTAEEAAEYLLATGQIVGGEIDDEELAQLTGGAEAGCGNTFTHKEQCWFSDGCDIAIKKYDNYECAKEYNGIHEMSEFAVGVYTTVIDWIKKKAK